MKYTRDDVIIWADDPRMEGAIGKQCWLGLSAEAVLQQAQNDFPSYTLDHVDTFGGFVARESCPAGSCPVYACIILKKEPKRHIVPYDFSLKEDRDALIGKRIKSNTTDMIVTDFACRCGYGWQVRIAPELGFDGEFLCAQFVFADGENAGKPVGKEVEE